MLQGSKRFPWGVVYTDMRQSSAGFLPAVKFHLVVALQWSSFGLGEQRQVTSENGEQGTLFVSRLGSPTAVQPPLLVTPALVKSGLCSRVGRDSRGTSSGAGSTYHSRSQVCGQQGPRVPFRADASGKCSMNTRSSCYRQGGGYWCLQLQWQLE